MKPTTQEIKSSRQLCLSRQVRQLRGGTAFGVAGSPQQDAEIDLDRAPSVLTGAGVPRTLSRAMFADAKFADADSVREWYAEILANMEEEASAAPYFVMFVGDGSNYIAAAALSNAVRRGKTVSWSDWHAFIQRYTERISRERLFDRSVPEEAMEVSREIQSAQEEDFLSRHVYEMLVIADFDINDVRDFAIPDITSLIRNRSDSALVTIITVPEENCAPLELKNPDSLGNRGALLRFFENRAKRFDGRQ
jgi:hypothetical protein